MIKIFAEVCVGNFAKNLPGSRCKFLRHLAVGCTLAAAGPVFGYSYMGEWGEVAQSASVVISSLQSAMEGTMHEAGCHYFATPFGGHLHRLSATVDREPWFPESFDNALPGHSGDIYGILGGATATHSFGHGTMTSVGLAGFVVRSQWNTFGWCRPLEYDTMPDCPMLEGHRQDQRRLGGVLFASTDYLAYGHLAGNVEISVGGDYLDTKLPLPFSASEYAFPYKRIRVEGFDLFTSLVVRQDVVTIGKMQFGPWVGLVYHRTLMRSFALPDGAEIDLIAGPSEDNSQIPSFAFNFLDVSCGLRLERLFLGRGRASTDVAVKVGWKCRAMQDDSINDPTYWRFRRRDRDSLVGSCELRRRLDQHWQVEASWAGQFANDHHANYFAANLSFAF